MRAATKRLQSLELEHVEVDYEPPDIRVPLSFKARRSVRVRVEGLVRLWKHLAEVGGDDPDQIDLTYVLETLLDKASTAAWARHGGMPQSEEGWAELLKRKAAEAKEARKAK